MNATHCLITARLRLRCWRPSDARALQAALDDDPEHLRAWLPWARGEPSTIDELAARLRGFRAAFERDEDYLYALRDRATDELIGGAGLHRRRGPHGLEIGYWIRAARVNRGCATEATAALTRVAFDHHAMQRVEIRCDPNNRASARVPLKLGFEQEARLNGDACDAHGAMRDTLVFVLTRETFPMSSAAHVDVAIETAPSNATDDVPLQRPLR